MCCSRLAANTGRKKVAKNRHLGTIAQLCRAISSQLRHVSTIGKNLLSNNISSTCPHNMVKFGPLAAEIVSLVWSTPGNFNGFRVTARHSSSGRQPNCGVQQRAPPIFDRAAITCLDSSCFQLLKPKHEPYLSATCSTGVEVVAGMHVIVDPRGHQLGCRTSIEAISSNLRPSIRGSTRYAHAPQRLPVSCAA